MNDSVSAGPNPAHAARRPLFRSTSFKLAVVITLIGGAMYAYALATKDPAPATDAAALARGFAGDAPPPAAPRLIDDGAPATLRLGLSFIVGFLLAWTLKKFVKMIVLISLLVAAAIFGLHKLGVLTVGGPDADTIRDSVQGAVDEGVEMARQSAGKVREFVTGYIPSAAAGAFGMFRGARNA